MTTIGHKVRKLRELKGLTQEQMADLLGLSATPYGNIERDEADVSNERLEQIAKVFGISVADLLAFDERTVFNNIENYSGERSGQHSIMNNTGEVTNNYQFPEELKKLYDDKIRLLEEKIEAQQREIEQLKKK